MSKENEQNTEVEVEETIETEETTETDAIDWEKRALKAEKAIMNNKKSSKKEKKAEEKPVEKDSSLSQKDTYALFKADVHIDDIDEVAEYAQFKGITVAEALGTTVVSTLMKENAEKRASAEAAHSGTARKANSQVSNEALIKNADEGNYPESEADMIRLIKARKGIS